MIGKEIKEKQIKRNKNKQRRRKISRIGSEIKLFSKALNSNKDIVSIMKRLF